MRLPFSSPEEEIPAPGIDREASEGRLAWLAGKGNHHPGRAGPVHRQGAAGVDAIDLPGGVSPPSLAQHHEHPLGVEGELDRPRNPGDHDLDAWRRRHVDAG
jgi:hypothetical protein